MPDRAGKVIDGAVGVLMLKIPEGPGLGRIQILRVIRYFICPHQIRHRPGCRNTGLPEKEGKKGLP